MARTVGAVSTKRGVPFWAHFFFRLEGGGAIRPLIDGLSCACCLPSDYDGRRKLWLAHGDRRARLSRTALAKYSDKV